MRTTFIESMKEKGIIIRFSGNTRFEEMIVETQKGIIVFTHRIDLIARCLEFPKGALQQIGKERLIEIFHYFEQLPGCLFIHFKQQNEKRKMNFLTELNYEVIEQKNYDDHFSFRIKEDIYMIKEQEKKKLRKELEMFTTVRNTLKKYEENEILIEITEPIMHRHRVYINGLLAFISVERKKEKMNMFILGAENKILAKKELKNSDETKQFLGNWIEDILKKQRLRALTDSYTYFFDQWMGDEQFYYLQKEIYEGLSVYFSPLEIEKIAATYVKKKEIHKKMEEHEHLIFFENKVIFFNTWIFEIKIFDQDEYLEKNIVEFLLKEEKEKVQNKVKSALGKGE